MFLKEAWGRIGVEIVSSYILTGWNWEVME
jgi:hypothetical protein